MARGGASSLISSTYGIVYKARHRATGAVVAIKKFKESDEDEEASFA